MSYSEAELEALYLRLEKPLYNFALRWVWNPGQAEEIVQEAFLRLWRHREQIEPATVKALMYKTVQNLALNERRKHVLKSTLTWFFNDESPTLEEEYIQRQDWAQVKRGIESLPKELRETLLLCQFSDLTYEEIGQMQDIPAGTVASRKSRALKMMNELVERKVNADAT